MVTERRYNPDNYCVETGLSRQELIQSIAALQGAFEFVNRFGSSPKKLEEIAELKKEISVTIIYFGGIAKIDEWLKQNDPGHNIIADYIDRGILTKDDICVE